MTEYNPINMNSSKCSLSVYLPMGEFTKFCTEYNSPIFKGRYFRFTIFNGALIVEGSE